MLDAPTVRSMPEADSSPKKLEPCVEDLDGTHAFYLQRKTLWPGPGHVCYITSTIQSPVSLLTMHPLPSSAVKIALLFFGILRISVIGPYNLFFAPRNKYLTCHLPCLLQKCSIPPYKHWRHTMKLCTQAVYTDPHMYTKWKQAWWLVFTFGRGNERHTCVIWRRLLILVLKSPRLSLCYIENELELETVS